MRGKGKNSTPYILTAFLPAPWIWFSLTVLRNVWITFLGYQLIICMGIPLIHSFFSKRTSAKEWGLKPDKKGIFISIIMGVLSGGIIVVFFHFFRETAIDPKSIWDLLSGFGVKGSNELLFILVMTLANATLEEFFWRGYLLGGLLVKLSKLQALLLSSVLFALHHIVTTTMLFPIHFAVIFSLAIMCSGLFFGLLRIKWGSLVSPVIVHLLADTGIIAVYLIYLR